MTFFNKKSASYSILNEFFNSPLANAILPNKRDAFEISVCSKWHADSLTSRIISSQLLKLLDPNSS